MRIDVHAHYWPAVYMEALVAAGRSDLGGFARQPDDFDDRLAKLDRNGVQLQILSAIGLDVALPDASAASETTAVINDAYADIARRYPGRFAAFGSVPLPHVEAAIAETERCFAELGTVGIGLPCIVNGRPIDSPEFEPFWENLARHNAVVYIHPVGTDSAVHPGLAEWGLHTGYGSPLQITVAPVRILYSGLSTRYPTLRFVFAMCGGFLPFIWPRNERNLRRGFARSAVTAAGKGFMSFLKDLPLDPQDPLSGLRRFWYDVGMQDVPAALLVAKDSYGADRLVLGSDEIFASLDDAISFVSDSAYLSDEEKAAILDRNAALMFGDDLAALTGAQAR
ncbi:MAG TPA: amidohydrolase family protein [Micromonosporaceae bacterium]|nr:amidohydrolase family protein [Micromonosporaceae bacterium]